LKNILKLKKNTKADRNVAKPPSSNSVNKKNKCIVVKNSTTASPRNSNL